MSQQEGYTPDIVDFAYQIIALHEENMQLKRSLAHYKELNAINSATINNTIKNQSEFVGTMLSACIDPDSVINQ